MKRGHTNKKIGDYTLTKHLGAGAFGDVYLAKKDTDNSEWAIKTVALNKLNNKKALEFFKQEVGIMRKINHPNIMHLDFFMRDNDHFFLVMQVCNKGDLRQWMKQKGVDHIEEKEAVNFLQQIALGFKELHKFDVMHRDFKTDNLMLHNDTLIIGDLGFAKEVQKFATTF